MLAVLVVVVMSDMQYTADCCWSGLSNLNILPESFAWAPSLYAMVHDQLSLVVSSADVCNVTTLADWLGILMH